MKKKFLAVYSWLSKYGNGFGNCDFTCNYDYPTMESIRDMERQIREGNGFSQVAVLNIIKLADEEDKESEDTE